MLKKILIIDDEPDFLIKALPEYGYEVEACTNGVTALKKIKKFCNDYKLIILDINMPVMDGWEVLKTIREDEKFDFIPVIVLTGIEDQEKEIIGLRKGADDYLSKPIRLPQLLARIDNLLKRFSKMTTTPAIETFLSEKEKEILKFVADGLSNQDIAVKLCIKDDTVKVHLTSIYKKLGVTNRVQAAVFATKHNLINN